MKKTTSYLKDLRSDMKYSLENDEEIHVSSNDIRHVEEALVEIAFEEKKVELLQDRLTFLVHDSRKGKVSDGSMAEQIVAILEEYRDSTWKGEGNDGDK